MAAITAALSQARSINSDNLTVLVKSFQQRQAKRVIDVGCGSGRLAAKLAGAGFDVTGVDPRAEAIAS
ncbi:methyltransferase domain-containing protein, partial [Marinobacter sp. C7]|uniref:class I SAM-dependent methyltransferase n=1 Tax=Marinobacter sp. C7 TaxID=2951363 RepID=UPI0033366C0C